MFAFVCCVLTFCFSVVMYPFQCETPTGHRNVCVSIRPNESEKKVDRKQLDAISEDRAGDKVCSGRSFKAVNPP